MDLNITIKHLVIIQISLIMFDLFKTAFRQEPQIAFD